MKPNKTDEKISKTVKSARISKSKYQKEIAAALSMTASYYNKHEKGIKAFTGS